jgi:hypothetical protein
MSRGKTLTGGASKNSIKSFQRIAFAAPSGTQDDLVIAEVVPANCKVVVRYQAGMNQDSNGYFHTGEVINSTTVQVNRASNSDARDIVIEITEYENIKSLQLIKFASSSSASQNVTTNAVVIANTEVTTTKTVDSNDAFALQTFTNSLEMSYLTTTTNIFMARGSGSGALETKFMYLVEYDF